MADIGHPDLDRGPAQWRVVVVGAGLMGMWHVHELRRLGAVIVAVADPDRERAGALARRARAAAVDSLKAGLGLGRPVDAVHVCTPPETHAALIHESLEGACHVLVEKPLAASASETETLLSAAAAVGRLLCPVHQFVFQSGVRSVLEGRDRLGEVRHVDYVTCTAGAAGADAAGRRAVVLEILPHPLSVVGRLLDRPLATADWSVHEPAPGELRATATIGGATVSVLLSTGGRPTRSTLRVIAARGSAHLDLFHGFAVRESPAVSRGRKVLRPFLVSAATAGHAATNLLGRAVRRQPAYPGLRELVRRFVAAARTGAPSPITPPESLDVARVVDHVRSA